MALAAAAALTGAQWERVLVAGVLAGVVLTVGLVLASAVAVVAAAGFLAAACLAWMLLDPPTSNATVGAVIAGSTLLLIGEFAFWSLSLRPGRRISVEAARRRILATLALLMVTVTTSAAAALAAQAPLPGSAGLLAVGAGAFVTALGIVAAMVWRQGGGETSGAGDASSLPPRRG